jgi:hypothetical protein
VQALEELLALLPDLRLEVPEHTMSADGEFGFSRWVMHATGANGPFELDGMDRTRVRGGLVCENYIFFSAPHASTQRPARSDRRPVVLSDRQLGRRAM